MHGLLNYILWLPIFGSVVLFFFPKDKVNLVRWFSVAVTAVTFILCTILYMGFDQTIPGIQPLTAVSMPWIKSFNIYYKLGIDGISLPMIWINGLLFLICSFSSFDIKKMHKGYYSLLLLLQGSIFGFFMALEDNRKRIEESCWRRDQRANPQRQISVSNRAPYRSRGMVKCCCEPSTCPWIPICAGV